MHIGYRAAGRYQCPGCCTRRIHIAGGHRRPRSWHTIDHMFTFNLEGPIFHRYRCLNFGIRVAIMECESRDRFVCWYEPFFYGKRADGGSYVTAVAIPLYICLIDADLAEPIIDLIISNLVDYHDLAGGGVSSAHTVNLQGIRRTHDA